MELQEFLDSKVYVKTNSGMTFKTPEEYVGRFIDKVSPLTTDFKIKTSAQSTNANEDGSQNVAYGRVVIEAKLPQMYTNLQHDSVIGIMYALDTQKPILKAYTGQSAWACTNLSIFNADQIVAAELTGSTFKVYDRVETYLNQITDGLEEWSRMVEKLMDTEYDERMLNEKIGYMLREARQNNFTQGVTAMVKDLDSPKSVYAVKNGTTSAWNVLSAATQYITDKVEITAKPDVTLFAHSLFRPELADLAIN